MAAGASAAREAQRARLLIEEYERRLAVERERLRGFTAASESEQRVGMLLRAMDAWGWHLLADRRWPGTRSANVDLIHVGPCGVFVVDVKAWAEPRLESGRLYRGDADASDEVDKLLRVTELVEQVVGAHGLVPVEVHPVVVLAGSHRVVDRVGRVHVVGEADLVAWLQRRRGGIDAGMVTVLAGALAEAFPPYEQAAPTPVAPAVPTPVLPRAVAPPPAETLFDVAALEAALVDAAAAEPIEAWMTFLHPGQVRLVRRGWHGPARLRGPAGTGKTVVGLHRAAYLAATRPGRILYTSYVRTLPRVLAALYARLAPDTADRVEFTGLHAWAAGFLRARGVRYALQPERAETLFWLAWSRTGKGSALAGVDVPVDYWREEVDCVLKGRGLTDFDEYAELARVGRRTPLQPEHRAAVWDLYAEYERLLREAGVHDYNDVLLLALAEVRREPPDPPYTAVLVDEVQDLNRVGVRLLHALVGDKPDGLLLIGDGQQAVYPGGFTLAEAGVSVTGRAAVLRTNYRNAAEILDAAAALVAEDVFDDLDGRPESGQREVETVRRGGLVDVVERADRGAHDAALLDAIRRAVADGAAYGDLAVLVPTNPLAARYHALLAGHGVPVVALADYDGRPVPRVKVGTFKRAKGLEFARVFLPAPGERESGHAERVELDRRERYVAMTRARDGLWLGVLRVPA